VNGRVRVIDAEPRVRGLYPPETAVGVVDLYGRRGGRVTGVDQQVAGGVVDAGDDTGAAVQRLL
jgi:hypothetical protein